MHQIVANSLISASLNAGIALSFWLIYRSGRFFHFAHGATITFGAYACFSVMYFGLPIGIGVVISILLSGLLGALMQAGIFEPLHRKKAAGEILLLASLGLYVVMENCIGLIFGYSPKSIRGGLVNEGYKILGARLTTAQILLAISAMLVFVLVWIVLRYSCWGLKLRAVASNPGLARCTGINIREVRLGAMVAGSAIAGLFGILMALDLDLSPGMGLQPLMMGVVVVIIGGVDRLVGVVLGALLLGITQNLGTWVLSAQWQEAIAFIVLLIFLLFRPEGFLGKRLNYS